MDGTIINTEDIYTLAATEMLSRYGKGPLTWDIKLHLQGLPGPQASKRLLEHYGLDIAPEDWMAETFRVQETLWDRSDFLPGALELLQYLKEKEIPIALGTSSNAKSFDKKTKHLQHGFQLFGKHVVTGDDPRIPPGRGKPQPDIWLVCLESLNKEREAQGQEPIDIEDCLVFEDGIPGVISGINSKATVVWIPHPEALKELNGKEAEIIGDHHLLDSLESFDKAYFGLWRNPEDIDVFIDTELSSWWDLKCLLNNSTFLP